MYQTKLKTVYAIAKYLHRSKTALAQEIRDGNDETAILRFAGIPKLDPYTLFCSDYVLNNATILFDYSKLNNSMLLDQWNLGLGYGTDEYNLIMVFRLKSNMMVMGTSTCYSGYGGMFCAPENPFDGYAFFIEPLTNWLKSRGLQPATD